MKCVNNVPDIYNDVVTIINLLEHIDIRHIADLIEAITKIFELVEKILNLIKPCADVQDSDYIQFIIQKI